MSHSADELSYRDDVRSIQPVLLSSGFITEKRAYLQDWIAHYLEKRPENASRWMVQSVAHHEDNQCVEEEDPFGWDVAQAMEWKKNLTELMPDHRFVIEVRPDYLVTWYQAFPDSPCEDDEDWWTLPGIVGVCFASIEEFEWLLEDYELFSKRRQQYLSKKNSNSVPTAAEQVSLRSWYLDHHYPAIHHVNRGVLLISRREGGERFAFASKVIRDVVGPETAPECSDFRALHEMV